MAECEWFVNDASTPSWCCNTHRFDGTGDYPTKYNDETKGEHPEQCDFAENAEIITEDEALERYNEWLDDVYGKLDICGLRYSASKVLKDVDEIAYNVGFNDWTDSEGIEYE